ADLVLIETEDGDYLELIHVKELIQSHNKPVIILSRKMDNLLRAEYYRLGVQDLIMTPWYPKVLDLRIIAALKRTSYENNLNQTVRWQMGDDRLILQADKHNAFLNGRELKLTFSQWNILYTLVGNGGVALSRSYLLRECLNFEKGDTRTLDNHIKNLRKVLGSNSHIETIHGYGYKLNGRQFQPQE
ncbi:MAG: response regulator transcription factor, partial [Spirochaetales bacterium]|nr:response regulator transcription factor [Spirochaetales bacterium]